MAEQTDVKTGAEDVSWDLTTMYPAFGDPSFEADLTESEELADKLAEEYKGRIADLDAEEMRDLLEQYQEVLRLAYKANMYAQMEWTVASEDPTRGALMAKVNEHGSRISQKLVFITLEWADVPEEKAATLMSNEVLQSYLHFLEVERLQKPYLLSEPEEKILAEKSTTGAQAWDRFFDEIHARQRYDWQDEKVPGQAVLQALYAPDREVRKAAQETYTRGLEELSHSTTYVFNQILADKASNDRLRGYPTWITSRNKSNEVDDESVQALVDAVTSRYDIVARYYTLKKKLLGVDELFDYDRYAPLPAADAFYTWDEAKETVLNAFNKFHPRMAQITNEFFDGRWIDAPVRPGKRGGAYAMPSTPDHHPFVFMNYQGQPRDVETLAHELGHGIHMYLSREQSLLNFFTPLTTAETASTFGEMLVFNDLLEKEDDPAVRLAMVTSKLESSFATVFRQISMNRFEDGIHTARREEGELSTERFSEIWMETQKAMFEGSVTMTDNYALWWSYIPHFIGSPGYVYAYAFGELLVMALYATYESGKVDNFQEKYFDLLTAGGSDWPHEIVKPMGIDLTDASFWQEGLVILDDMVKQAEALAEEVG